MRGEVDGWENWVRGVGVEAGVAVRMGGGWVWFAGMFPKLGGSGVDGVWIAPTIAFTLWGVKVGGGCGTRGRRNGLADLSGVKGVALS